MEKSIGDQQEKVISGCDLFADLPGIFKGMAEICRMDGRNMKDACIRSKDCKRHNCPTMEEVAH